MGGNPKGPENSVVPNITPDKDTGLTWFEEEIADYLSTGNKPDGDVAGGLMGDGFESGISQMVKLQSQERCSLLKEAPGSRRALVVHDELDDLAAFGIDFDGLRILTANVDNGAGLRQNGVSAHRVAGDFRNDLVGHVEKRQGDAPVPRADDVGQRASQGIGLAQELGDELVCGFLHRHTGRNQSGLDAIAVHKDALRCARADVQTNDGPV